MMDKLDFVEQNKQFNIMKQTLVKLVSNQKYLLRVTSLLIKELDRLKQNNSTEFLVKDIEKEIDKIGRE